MIRKSLSIVLALVLGGCASIIEGSRQEIEITTEPPGADCTIQREGKTIARVSPTPGTAMISKTREDLTIV